MKIAFNIDFDHTRVTGIGRYGTEVISSWIKLGNSCELWMNQAAQGKPFNVDIAQSKIRYFPRPRRVTNYLYSELYAKKAEVKWVHSTNGNLLPSIFSFKQIAVIYDLTPFLYAHMKEKKIAKEWQAQIRNIVKKADCITVISKATLNDALTFFPEVKDKIFLTPLGIDHFTKKENQQSSKKHLLTVGTVEPRKNIDGLLKAYSILLEQNSTIPPLVIAGMDGFKADEYKQMAVDLGISENVRYTGFITDDELSTLYSEAYCLVHPAHHEGFGFTVPEAFTWDLPVVAANTGGLGEFFNKAAWMIDPSDPESIANGIELALDSGVTMEQKLEREALKRKLTWKNCAMQTLNAIKTIDS